MSQIGENINCTNIEEYVNIHKEYDYRAFVKPNGETCFGCRRSGDNFKCLCSDDEEDEQYKKMCDNDCGIMLTENTPIMCHTAKNGTDSTFCNDCYYDDGYYLTDKNEDNEDEIQSYKEDVGEITDSDEEDGNPKCLCSDDSEEESEEEDTDSDEEGEEDFDKQRKNETEEEYQVRMGYEMWEGTNDEWDAYQFCIKRIKELEKEFKEFKENHICTKIK